MRRSLFVFIYCVSLVAQQIFPIIGFQWAPGSSSTLTALSSAASGGFSASWLRYSLIPTSSYTISKVRVLASSVTGTLGANDLVLDIYSDSSGVPGSSLASTNTVTSTPTGAGWVEFTGLSQAVTAYTQYWLILRNANATPTSNFITYRTLLSVPASFIGGPLASVYTSTTSGGAWTAVSNSVSNYRIETSLGAFYGVTVELINNATAVPSTYRVRSTIQSGVLFTSPANVGLNVRGCSFAVTKIGSPTGNLSCVIYSGSSGTLTLVATSDSVYAPTSFDSTGRLTAFFFASTVNLPSGGTYRVALAESAQSDSTSNYYVPNSYAIDSNANSLALLPFSGTLRGAYCSGSCTSFANWTSDGANVPAFALLLENTPFSATGGQKGFGFFQ